jgi:hypothetical protein
VRKSFVASFLALNFPASNILGVAAELGSFFLQKELLYGIVTLIKTGSYNFSDLFVF